MFGWWVVYAEKKLSPWILLGHDGNILGHHSLLEGIVAATPSTMHALGETP
jgi:hypothetical protein